MIRSGRPLFMFLLLNKTNLRFRRWNVSLKIVIIKVGRGRETLTRLRVHVIGDFRARRPFSGRRASRRLLRLNRSRGNIEARMDKVRVN